MTAPLTRWLVALAIAGLAMSLLLAHAAAAKEAAGDRRGAPSVADSDWIVKQVGRPLRVIPVSAQAEDRDP